MLKVNNPLKEDSTVHLSAQYMELLDIVAEIIAFDLLKKIENKKEDQHV